MSDETTRGAVNLLAANLWAVCGSAFYFGVASTGFNPSSFQLVNHFKESD